MEFGTVVIAGYGENFSAPIWRKGALDYKKAAPSWGSGWKYVRKEATKQTIAYRCPKCGYVELHAD